MNVQPEELALSPPRAGSSEASQRFETVFQAHYPRLVGLLARITGDHSQAEEIAAETFSKLARRPTFFTSREDPIAWLYRVATNAALDVVRATTRRRKTEEAAGAERLRSETSAGALDDLLRRERCERVRIILGGMKPRDAELLLLRSGGMAYREIAHLLGVQPSSIGTLLARAEREFEHKYRARYGEEV